MKNEFNQLLQKTAIAVVCFLVLFASACKKDLNPKSSELTDKTKLSAKTNAVGLNGVKGVCYMEVNNADFRDVGKYNLASGQPLFDIGIIFAANINYNTTTQQAVLYYNTQVTNVLSNASTYIQPLQAKGIKVLLSILGNHQGAGICNFPTQAAAQAFAQQLSNAVTTYGLDGIDFDDEYADYGTNGTGQVNSSSFVYLVTALRQLMPNKIISFYDYGPAASELSYNGVTVGSKINYSWNAIYGSWSVPNVPGLANSYLAPAAIDVQNTSASTATSLATETINNSYGVFLYYNLPDADSHTYLSGISNALYGQNTVYNSSGSGSTSGIISGDTYKIVSSLNSSSLIEVAGGATSSGTVVDLWSNNSPATTNQEWLVTSLGNGYYKISPKNASGLALDVSGSSQTAGTQIQVYTANGTAAQQWQINSTADGYYNLVPACATAMTMDISGSSTTNGAKVQIWGPNSTSAQKFSFVQQ